MKTYRNSCHVIYSTATLKRVKKTSLCSHSDGKLEQYYLRNISKPWESFKEFKASSALKYESAVKQHMAMQNLRILAFQAVINEGSF